MVDTARFPGGVSELRFLESYMRYTLRRPQVAADTMVRAMTVAGTADRTALVAAVAGQLAEAARQLLVVYRALDDRSRSVAESLARGTRPGAAEWVAFAQEVGSIEPEEMVRSLALGEEALEYAQALRGQPDLEWVAELLGAIDGGGFAVATVEPTVRDPGRLVLAGGVEGELGLAVGLDEGDAANLATHTAELVDIARGLLESYVTSRRSVLRARG